MRKLVLILSAASALLLLSLATAIAAKSHHHRTGSDPVLLGDQNVETVSDGGTNAAEAFGYTASVIGTATDAMVYLTSTSGVRIGLYADKGICGEILCNQPGVRLDQGSVASNVRGWVDVKLNAGVQIIQGTRYWLAIASQSGKSITYRDKGSGGSNLDWSLNGLANPASTVKQWNSNPASVYLNGTVPAVAPANTTPPAVSGTPQQGQTLTASQGSWSGTTPITYTYAWSDGATGQTDTLGAADVGQNVSVTVTATNTAGSAHATSSPVGPVTAAPATTTSLFANATPGTPDAGPDGSQVSLGLKFHADRDGNILGVRFYKSTANTGAHVGTLFDASGVKLAQATFTSETASGWQDVQFASPVAIKAGAEYTASYNATAGHYADDLNYAWPKTVTPLTGDAGTYCYGTPDCVPASTYQASNYYVDVDFQATGSPPAPVPPANTTRPAIGGATPQQGNTLTVSNGTWSGDTPISYSYRWQDCAAGTCQDITGATASTYTLQASDVGSTIDAIVTATNAAGQASATSDQTATVTASSGGGGTGGAYQLPADRMFAWNPGLNPVGGIPARTNISQTISPSGGDDTTTIQAALDACPTDGVVKLAAGVFHITSQGLFIEHACTLRGAGPGPGNWPAGTPASGTGGTYLEKPTGTSYPVVSMGPQWGWGGGTPTNLTADATRGSNTATVASTVGITAGNLVIINELTDPNISHWNSQDPENASGWFEEPNRPLGDVMEVQSVSGNTITFTTPLPITYQVAQTAHLYPLQNVVHKAGLEDVYLYGGEGGDGGGGIHMWDCDHCWVKHVEDTWTVGAAIHIDQSFGVEVRDSYFHDSQGGLHNGGANYGIGINWYTSNTLVENNISTQFNKVDVFRSAGGGNVFGYNYLDDGADSGGQWMETVMNSSHMTTPHYELFEGNEAANFDQDDRWGNSAYITIFRNHLIGYNRDYSQYGPLRAAGVTQWHWWQSFVGNVLGTPAHPGITRYEDINPTNWGGSMWMVCWQASDNVSDGGKCQSTLLRDGNFDYLTGQVHWHGIGGTGAGNGLTPPANATLPDSMYLSSKPAFFGSSTWPWVDGSNATTPLSGTLPARTRYDAGTPNG